MRLTTAVLAVALLSAALPAAAQSLGDLAKREQERRKAAPPAAKTYTNDDLKQVPAPSGTPAQGVPAAAAGGDAAKPADEKTAEPEKVDSTKAPEAAKDEKYWRARIESAREEVRRNEAFREALQSRINALTTDFTARDDPYQRAKLADDRQKALAELARVTAEVEQGKKSIGDIEEEARRAGVPPGWLR